jgi:hypothetical protein
MSSHFMPLPRSSMMRASSSGDHLLCFLAGLSAEWGGMLRFTGISDGGTPAGKTVGSCGAPTSGAAVSGTGKGRPMFAGGAVATEEDGAEAGRLCLGDEPGDSSESERLRREAISTVTVSRLHCLRAADVHGQVEVLRANSAVGVPAPGLGEELQVR